MTTNGDKPTPFLEKLEGFARTIVRPTVTLALVGVASLMVLRGWRLPNGIRRSL